MLFEDENLTTWWDRREHDLAPPEYSNSFLVPTRSGPISRRLRAASTSSVTFKRSHIRRLSHSLIQAARPASATVLSTKTTKFERPRLRGLPTAVVYTIFAPPIFLFCYLHTTFVQSSELYAVSYAPAVIFLSAFIFRYYRLIVHTIFFILTKPIPAPAHPTLIPAKDVTVVVPTVGPDNPDFKECISSICANNPAKLHIVVSCKELVASAVAASTIIAAKYGVRVEVSSANVANKRRQLIFALQKVQTQLVCFADDHVFWPCGFLVSALAPFEDSRVGTVGTTKRVRRENKSSAFQSFFNVLGCLYLERHNFEILATNSIDNGVFVISGRTCIHRSAILQTREFYDNFCNETFFFGIFGPLNADDDNFVYRHIVREGWDVVIQCGEQATVETTLGEYPKFLQQCTRWVRTTWRSNLCSLFTDGTVWRRQPWCVYAVHLTSLVNFALFYDSFLIMTLFLAVRESEFCACAMIVLVVVVFSSKVIKTLPYFLRHPRDLVFLPACIFFGYYHSIKKLYAGLTFYETAWGSRKNVQ